MTNAIVYRIDGKPKSRGKSLGMLCVALSICSASFAESDNSRISDNDDRPVTKPVELTPAFLERDGAVIGAVTIGNRNVFDIDQPEEDKWLYRLANGIHVVTRPSVIRSQLLFEPGADFSKQSIEETERLLRKNRYLRDAEIEAIRYEDGVVDLNVRTEDAWTLKADFAFGRKGGVNTGGLGFEENNLLGTGTHIAANYRQTADRDTTRLEFSNRHFRGSRYTLAGHYSANSDGVDQQLAIFRPFFSLNSLRAGGATLYQGERVDTLYDRGLPMAEFAHESSRHEVFRGWSNGLHNNGTRRWLAGFVLDRHRFSAVENSTLAIATIPNDRHFAFPFVGFEYVEDEFETATNFDQIHRTEDLYFGTRYSARLGYSSRNRTSRIGSLHFQASYRSAVRLDKTETLIGGVEISGRLENAHAANTLFSAFATFHKRQSENRLFYAKLLVAAGNDLDLDNPVLLGGASGLRGFPLRYQSGTGKVLLTLEQRLYADWYPFRLFHVGGAVFFDAGRAWGRNPVGGGNLGLLKNVGLGLRLASARSSSGRVLHINLAHPLDGDPRISKLQFLLETKHSF